MAIRPWYLISDWLDGTGKARHPGKGTTVQGSTRVPEQGQAGRVVNSVLVPSLAKEFFRLLSQSRRRLEFPTPTPRNGPFGLLEHRFAFFRPFWPLISAFESVQYFFGDTPV